MDAVLEVKARLRAMEQGSMHNGQTRLGQTVKTSGVGDPPVQAPNDEGTATAKEQKKVVADSQAASDVSDLEEEIGADDGDDDDDDMLLDRLGSASNDPVNPDPQPHMPTDHNQADPKDQSHPGPYLLIIPSPARILSPAMHMNHIRTHALLVHLMRTLQQLTQNYAICVLLINTTVEREATAGNAREDGPSAFASKARIKPALGKTWDWYLDLSCMISSPFEAAERKGGVGNGNVGKRCCVEVLHDRYCGRVGRWAVIDMQA